MSTEQTKKAYYVERDGAYSNIREVMVHPSLIDNATFYKTLSAAKKDLISDLQYNINAYKECLAYVRSIKVN
jgi:hypothetical protein